MSVSPQPAPGRTTRRSLIEGLRSPEAGTRWAEFDRIYREIVMNIAMGSGLRYHDAEEVTQDVFEELVTRLTDFKLGSRPGSFRAYLRRLVQWRTRNRHLRNRRTETVSLDSEEGPEIAAPQKADGPDYEAVVIGAMKAMSRDLKVLDLQVLELVHCSQWSAEHVAEALQIPPGRVYQIKHRHKDRLERELRRRLCAEL